MIPCKTKQNKKVVDYFPITLWHAVVYLSMLTKLRSENVAENRLLITSSLNRVTKSCARSVACWCVRSWMLALRWFSYSGTAISAWSALTHWFSYRWSVLECILSVLQLLAHGCYCSQFLWAEVRLDFMVAGRWRWRRSMKNDSETSYSEHSRHCRTSRFSYASC